uniref:Enediyne biosynthesis protein n=1 Tax=Streptoalloteichus sp. ATCC 53650 TaxID=756733 RepID=K4P0X5_9PSEU|nr:hypothetical protein [Streptoalloteichus sp. ATCC 53650]
MLTTWRALRRRILTPDVSATRLDVRGFHRKDEPSTELLEKVGRIFLAGFGHAAEARTPAAAEIPLQRIEPRFRGFAYEGAAMGFAVRDGLPFGRRDHTTRFLAGEHASHQLYIAYCGIGWAMARLPRFRWPNAEAFDPLVRWLVLDGYGFHQAYFHTRRYVHDQYRDPRFPWPSAALSDYANRVIDQGIGRALWFVCGTDAARVADTIDSFPESRRADLYAGTGLAATYAGGADTAELRGLRERAGRWRGQLAQGSAFAAEARVRAGLVVPHVEQATAALCGTTPEVAATVTQEAIPTEPVTGELPAYEAWRQRIAAELLVLGGVDT